MKASEFITLVATVAGPLIALAVAVAGRQFFRPRLSLELGVFDFDKKPRLRFRSAPKTTLFFGLPEELQQIALPCPLRITNHGHLPIADIEVELKFPIGALVENSAITAPIGQNFAVLKLRQVEGRSVLRFADHAQVRLKIGTLRPKESIVTAEPLQLRTGELLVAVGDWFSKTPTPEHLRVRYANVAALRGAITLGAHVWSNTRPPLSHLFNVVWCAAGSRTQLVASLDAMCKATGKEFAPGTYLNLRPWRSSRRYLRYEFAGAVMASFNKAADIAAALWSPEAILNADMEMALITLPPWGFWGEAPDIRSALGLRLLKHSKKESGADP